MKNAKKSAKKVAKKSTKKPAKTDKTEKVEAATKKEILEKPSGSVVNRSVLVW